MGWLEASMADEAQHCAQAAQPGAAQPKRTTFNPDFKFGPPPADPPVFRMTSFLPEVTVGPFYSAPTFRPQASPGSACCIVGAA